MTISFYAREPHFFDHLLPIWQLVGGDFYVGAGLEEYAKAHGITPVLGKPTTGVAVVAGVGDLRRVKYLDAVFLEHGAGQSYSGVHPSHPGGSSRENVILYIVPNERVVARNLGVYPDVPNVIVGCPKMDRWQPPSKGPDDGVIALSFHWNARTAPEALSAWNHYRPILRELGQTFPGKVIGHSHPRMWPTMKRRYGEAGIEVVTDFEEVIERASVYVCDNSSTLYEFASLDRPVVVLNAPWYRRDVEHGLRFWEFADVGVQVDGPRQLVEGIERAWADPPEVATRRREIVGKVYAHMDGRASERAAKAILNLNP